MSKSKIEVQGLEVAVNEKDMGDYINLTDIARWKNPDAPSDVVKNWMWASDMIDFIGLWEILNNPDFNSVEFGLIKSDEANISNTPFIKAIIKQLFSSIFSSKSTQHCKPPNSLFFSTLLGHAKNT